MFRRFRRLFIAFSAFGYAFLGGGPSLWALGLAEASHCEMPGCTCPMSRHGGVCTCAVFQRALLKKFPSLAKWAAGPMPMSGCQMRQAPLRSEEAADGLHSVPSQQLHTLPEAPANTTLLKVRAALTLSSRALSFHPEPPTPIPD